MLSAGDLEMAPDTVLDFEESEWRYRQGNSPPHWGCGEQEPRAGKWGGGMGLGPQWLAEACQGEVEKGIHRWGGEEGQAGPGHSQHLR